MQINGQLSLTIQDQHNSTQQQLQREQAALFAILNEREKEFGFHPDVIIEYPESIGSLLENPALFLSTHITEAELRHGVRFSRSIILTTYGDILHTPLTVNGYHAESIDMPAGPDHTFFFTKELDPSGDSTYYLEAVDEQDEKIRPSFIIKLSNEQGMELGGMSGSIWEQGGEKFAYIATVVVREDAPAGSGSRIAEAAWEYLRKSSVKRVNLGTQTADQFYSKQGFHVIHTILPRLRNRKSATGNLIHNDLVIMRKDL